MRENEWNEFQCELRESDRWCESIKISLWIGKIATMLCHTGIENGLHCTKWDEMECFVNKCFIILLFHRSVNPLKTIHSFFQSERPLYHENVYTHMYVFSTQNQGNTLCHRYKNVRCNQHCLVRYSCSLFTRCVFTLIITQLLTVRASVHYWFLLFFFSLRSVFAFWKFAL